MAEIRIENLHKAFGNFVAVRDSTFTVRDGEFFCLLGPSGCGKTTTLRMIAGLELPTTGRIFLGDEDVTFKRASHRDIAFVFQLFALYPHMNVRHNIAFPLVSQGMLRSEIAVKVAEAARILRIKHLLYDKRFTIEGARQSLHSEAKAPKPARPSKRVQAELFATDPLPDIRRELQEILQLLK